MLRFGTFLYWRTMLALVGVAATLGGIAWVTQALRRFDLVTAKGQAVAVYLGLTLLSMPRVFGVVLPIAFVVALVMVFNRLQTESGIVAITASGVSQRQLVRPFLAAALTASFVIGALAVWLSPLSARTVYDMLQAIRADIVANVIQPGRFITIEAGLTFHIRNRDGDGSLLDLFILDDRNPDYAYTYSARRGRMAEVMGRSMIVMEQGTIERHANKTGGNTFVTFGSYAFDLDQFAPKSGDFGYGLQEQTLSDLIARRDDSTRAEVDPEIYSRVSEPIYPLAQTFVVFLFLGFPTSNRRGQALPVTLALIAGTSVRLIGFVLYGLAKANPAIASVTVAVPVAMTVLFGGLVLAGIHPTINTAFIDGFIERIRRLLPRRRVAS